MRILVLAQEIGGNAPGIVYERLLAELGRHCEWDVAAVSYAPSVPLSPGRVIRVPYPRMKYAVKRAMVSLLGRDVFARRRCRVLDEVRPGDYDAVLSLCSNDRFWSLEAGMYLKDKVGAPWACYFVDAIPAPVAWQPDGAYRRAILRTVRRAGAKMDYLASICDEMLSYQLSLMPDQPSRNEVLLPPVSISRSEPLEPRPEGPYRFLYAGRIYGKRTPRNLLDAFSLLLKEVPDAELVFAGTEDRILEDVGRYGENIRSRISLLPWMADITPEVVRATALIDLDADVEHDVFLSSKLFSYLTFDRPIICETGGDSPSRRLFAGIPSIFQCGHDAGEIKAAMAEAIQRFDTFDYSDREPVLDRADVVQVALRLFNSLKYLQR